VKNDIQDLFLVCLMGQNIRRDTSEAQTKSTEVAQVSEQLIRSAQKTLKDK